MAYYAYNNICILLTCKKTPRKKPAPARPAPAQPSAAQLWSAFRRVLPSGQVWKLAALQKDRFYHRLFTPLLTLWLLLFQRLRQDHTLEKAVTDALAGGADALAPGLSGKLRSPATASYSDARQRLSPAFLRQCLALQARQMVHLDPQNLWHGLTLCLLDGSTVRLRPYGDISKKFPPNGNQTRPNTYWCLMRVVAGFCARTGAALAGASGSFFRSEQRLACQMMLRQAVGSCLYIGDRNFGVFRIVQTARAMGSHVLVRLTDSRARRLLGRGLRPGDHPVRWSATTHDQLQPGCPRSPVDGRLLAATVQRKGFRAQRLYLFTSLADPQNHPLAEMVHLYGLRWHVELNLRYLKSQMHLAQLECKSAAMARKEWLAGLMAYNLTRAAMLCAALRSRISPLALSFSCCRRHLQHWLQRFADGSARTSDWHRLLDGLNRARLPQRRKVRPPEPRAQRHLRQPYPPLIGSRKKARQQLKSQPTCGHKN
jgi:Transposase DDE domain